MAKDDLAKMRQQREAYDAATQELLVAAIRCERDGYTPAAKNRLGKAVRAYSKAALAFHE